MLWVCWEGLVQYSSLSFMSRESYFCFALFYTTAASGTRAYSRCAGEEEKNLFIVLYRLIAHSFTRLLLYVLQTVYSSMCD
jgi:hypothetical protein